MKVLYDIEDMLLDEMKSISKQEKLSSSDVEDIYKMVDILKDIETFLAMKNAGYSGTYYGDYDMSMRGPRYSYDDMSYARGRDSMGRFTSGRDGYSGHDNKEGLIEKLNMAMSNARTEEERDSYRRVMEQLKR